MTVTYSPDHQNEIFRLIVAEGKTAAAATTVLEMVAKTNK